ncbi:MAG: HD domain-containing protein [Planctomycetota bacterium]
MSAQPGERMWQVAASLAARFHSGQLRKDGVTPYIAHPFRVAMTVRQVFECDDEIATAIALLHDVIEDTPADYDDVYGAIRRPFDKKSARLVADGVAALTKDMRLRGSEREREYDAHLASSSWRAAIVKLADTYDNFVDRLTRVDEPDTESIVRRCERAIAIAQPFERDHEAMPRAIGEVRALIESVDEER